MKRVIILLSSLLFMLTLLQGCGEPIAKGGPVEGLVLEEGTRTPLSNVIVVATWHGTVSSLADSSGVCFHVESTTTNEKGLYYLPAWKKTTKFARSKKQFVDVVVYKAGYQWPDKVLEKYDEYYLTPAKGITSERLAYLERVVRSTGCRSAGSSQQNSYQLYETLYKEAKPLVKTEEEQKTLEWVRRIAAYAWIATDEGLLTQSKANKLIEEHLKEHLK